MKDDSITIADSFAPAIGQHKQEQLDTITKGLNEQLDSKELAMIENLNVRENTKDKDDVLWPNKDNHLHLGMASGLEALETLGSSDYKADTEKS